MMRNLQLLLHTTSIFQLLIKKAHIEESPGLMNSFSFLKTDLGHGINTFTGAYCLYLFCVCDAILLSLCCVISVFSEWKREENLSCLTLSVTLDKIVMFCHQRGSVEEINGIQDEREIWRKKKETELWIKTVCIVLRLKITTESDKTEAAAVEEGKKNRGWNLPKQTSFITCQRSWMLKKWPQSAHLPKARGRSWPGRKAVLPRGVNLFLRRQRAQVAERPRWHQAGRRWSQRPERDGAEGDSGKEGREQTS